MVFSVFTRLWNHHYCLIILEHFLEFVKLLSRVWLFGTPWTVCSLPVSSLHGILQARILEWVAIPFSRGSSWPRERAQVSCIAGWHFAVWAPRDTPIIFPSAWEEHPSPFAAIPYLPLPRQPLSQLCVSVGLPLLDISCKWDHTACNFCDWLLLLSGICLQLLHGRAVSPLSLRSGLPESRPFLWAEM